MVLMVISYMPLGYPMLLTGLFWFDKWQAIKSFHVGVEIWQGCISFLSSSLLT